MKNNLKLAILVCLTLGLAPFAPEPHIWGKIKWLWGGGVGMQVMDFFDVLLHGLPWFYLLYVLLSISISKDKESRTGKD